MSSTGQVRLCRPWHPSVRFSSDSRRSAALRRISGPGQLQTLAVQQTALLFDDLIGASKKQLWDREAERLGGLEIDDQFEFRGLLEGQIGRLLPLENPV